MKLCFYNWFGNGDLFESREFVKDWMRLCGVHRAAYAYQDRYKGIFEDVPQLDWTPLTNQMNSQQGVFKMGDTLFVNTWIGRGWNGKETDTSSYVLNPGVGCVLENLYRMHNDLLREAGLGKLPRDIVEYIPTIDYTRVNLGRSQSFLEQCWHKNTVLICNGPTTSAQSVNHDFSEVLDLLLPSPHLRVIATQTVKTKYIYKYYTTDEITGRSNGGHDLNAISYLSRFCNVIVGRCSGPHMTAQVLENWMDSTKTLLCFTTTRNGACFIREPERMGLKMKVVWSPETEPVKVAKVIQQAINA